MQLSIKSTPTVASQFAGQPVAALTLIRHRCVLHRRREGHLVVRAALPGLPNKNKPDYDTSAPQVNPAEFAFTRRREVLVGRTAMTGFLAASIGEIITNGLGPVGQVSLETGLPSGTIYAVTAAIVAINLAVGLRPGGFTFSDENQADVAKRPGGPTQGNVSTSLETGLQDNLGTSKLFGFTKKNELFVGRTAMIGFLAAVIGEKVMAGNPGPFSQITRYVGIPYDSGYAGVLLAAWISFFFFAAIGFGRFGPEDDRKDIY